MLRRATISPDGLYRYTLERCWARGGDRILWIMLNPSRADALIDDPTIRRCIGFSQQWGYSALEVVNLFAFRTESPATLRGIANPVGPRNAAAIGKAISRSSVALAAWGAFDWAAARAEEVLSQLRAAAGEVLCLGTTRDGWPRHPLYVRASTSPCGYELPATRAGRAESL